MLPVYVIHKPVRLIAIHRAGIGVALTWRRPLVRTLNQRQRPSSNRFPRGDRANPLVERTLQRVKAA